MAAIPETPQFDAEIYLIETTDKVLGGTDGKINLQAGALANRTAFLKQEVEAAGATATSAEAKADSALLQVAAAEEAMGSAAASAASALQYKTDALAAKALAEQARSSAQAAAADAAAAATGAAADRVTAGQRAAEAQSSATAAVNAASFVQADRVAAQTARNEAVAAQGAAETAATGAAADRVLAVAAAEAADADRIAAEAARDALLLDLPSTTDALKGAGQVGYGEGLAYAEGTVGAAIQGRVQVVNDVATLRAIAPNASRRMRTKFFDATAKVNGSGGEWFAITGAAAGTFAHNGGTIVVPVGGDGSAAWVRDYSWNVNVKWFGAVGNGVDDDRPPIQAAIDSGAKRILFPVGVYAIGDTLHLGRWSIDANGNVLGWGATRMGVTLIGEGQPNNGGTTPTIKWIGSVQAGDNKITASDSVGTYSLITNDAPMISLIAAHYFRMENITLDGDNKAFSGIWTQGNSTNNHYKGVMTKNVKVGFRNGCSYDHVNGLSNYWGRGGSPYFTANVYNMPSYGGWQNDTQHYDTCHFSGSLTGYASESAQAIMITATSTNFIGGSYPILLAGGWLSLVSPGFDNIGATPSADIYVPTGVNQLFISNLHSESNATQTVLYGTGSGRLVANNCDTMKISTFGGLNATLSECRNVRIWRQSVASPLIATLNSCAVTEAFYFYSGSYDDRAKLVLNTCILPAAGWISGPGAASVAYTLNDCINSDNTSPANSTTISGNVAAANFVVGSGGVDFSGKGNVAGMTSELLDDYEEGTWTPAYAPATGSFAAMPKVSYGSYSKVGRIVTVHGWIYTNGNVDITGASGGLRISGLPFAAAGTNIPFSVAIGNASGLSGERPTAGYIFTGTSYIQLTYVPTVTSNFANSDVTDLLTGNFANQNQIYFSATYESAT